MLTLEPFVLSVHCRVWQQETRAVPFPNDQWRRSPNMAQWCPESKIALGWDNSIVSVGGGRELVTVDWFGTPHRIRGVCSICVHHDLRFSLDITLQFWGPPPCEVVFSQRDNVFRNCRERVLSPHLHTLKCVRSGLGEKVTLPCSGYMEYVVPWPGEWPWACHFVKSLGPLQRASINRNQTNPQRWKGKSPSAFALSLVPCL